MAKSNHHNPVIRILITLLGAALILLGVGTVVLGIADSCKVIYEIMGQ